MVAVSLTANEGGEVYGYERELDSIAERLHGANTDIGDTEEVIALADSLFALAKELEGIAEDMYCIANRAVVRDMDENLPNCPECGCYVETDAYSGYCCEYCEDRNN